MLLSSIPCCIKLIKISIDRNNLFLLLLYGIKVCIFGILVLCLSFSKKMKNYWLYAKEQHIL
ncbi:hypothetical protein BD560DRAFT_391522 [Blakeslea trispora]|nr:hypothetical protein BD560DRAFT_391522 [Blakeslea trispora]